MELNLSQSQVVNHSDGPALVLAVPGSGKTTVLLKRLYRLIQQGVKPERILSMTFSRVSANDMKNRYKRLTNTNTVLNISTIHSFSYRILYNYFNSKGLAYDILSNNDNNRFKIISELYYNEFNSPITDSKYELINNLYGYTINMMKNYEDVFASVSGEARKLSVIAYKFDKYKRKNNLIDYDDMLRFAYDILLKNKNILNNCRKLYDYIQIDEGQDTSKLQMEIIKLIAEPKRNLLIVADDDQSIYGFRGADPNGLFRFAKDWKNVKLYYLENNYRSSKNIVESANNFIKYNTHRFEKSVKAVKSYSTPIEVSQFDDVSMQNQYIIDLLRNSNSLSDTAILYRNNFSVLSLVETLEAGNIKYRIRDCDLRFFRHWIIKDIDAMISLAKNKENIEALSKIYYKITGYISKKQLLQIKNNKTKNVFHSLLQIPNLPDYYKKNFVKLDSLFFRLNHLKPIDALNLIDNELKYGEYLVDYAEKYGYSKSQITDYLEVLKLIAKPTNSYEEFLGRFKHIELTLSKGVSSKTGVTLSTIHGSKGLEFNKVILIDCIENEFPSEKIIKDSKTNIAALEEERRLFYVAMTRAIEKFYILYPANHFNKITKPSIFINELLNAAKR